ncbi:hypothetical protein N7541_000972 [Penicillium brevicompactum]|uniref:Uncharacterized protein n=1 Tax=Penicillium brevicompactum TaxID=5074 RepID=A0A9W9V5I4_PENBR|nr:hypothetical protein N7541_000972 [Penicillium brevicompactum]
MQDHPKRASKKDEKKDQNKAQPPMTLTVIIESKSNGKASGETAADDDPDECLFQTTVDLESPDVAGVTNEVIGQFWFKHFNDMLGLSPKPPAPAPAPAVSVKHCVEETNRVLALADALVVQQKELISDMQEINFNLDGALAHDEDFKNILNNPYADKTIVDALTRLRFGLGYLGTQAEALK